MSEMEKKEPRRLLRSRADRMVAGVAGGLGQYLGVDPVIIRIAFAVSVFFGGLGLLAYAALALFVPTAPGGEGEQISPAPVERSRGLAIVAGTAILIIALSWGIFDFGDGFFFGWGPFWIGPPLLLIEPARGGKVLHPGPAAPREAPPRAGLADLYRGGFGVALVLGAALLFLYANGALGQARDVILALVVASLALALILAPFLWRLGRNLAAERAERIRSQERAELAAHLHDSVLQTLTLVQRRAGDPGEVARLARRQERALRQWLFVDERKSAAASLARALEDAANEVEDAHRTAVDAVVVGDRGIDERSGALVAAAREALVNAAKFASETGPIALYGELSEERAQVFVRDRGNGFDPDAIPADRRGIGNRSSPGCGATGARRRSPPGRAAPRSSS